MNKKIEVAGLKGEFDLFLYDSEMNLKDHRHVENLTVDSGFHAVCDAMGEGSVQPFKYCGIGTGTNAPVAGDTALVAETARVQGGYTLSSNTVWKNDATFGAGVGTGSIQESGMFNATVAPWTMLCRQTFAVVNKQAGDTLVVTWQYTLSSS